MSIAKKSASQEETSADRFNALIVDCIQDIKGKDILKLDLRDLEEASTDYFIVCHGESQAQVKAIADNLSRAIKGELGVSPSHTEGQHHANWIIVDYFDTVVHIFNKESRDFYKLENLWSDAVVTKYED